MDLDEQTLLQYEQLSFFEREEIARWIQKYFNDIPVPAQIKKSGLEGLLSGFCSARSALVLIRHAMNALRIHPK